MLSAFSYKVQAHLALRHAKVTYMREPFKARMKRLRLRAGFKSHKAAADAIGCTRGNVSMWEAPSSDVKSVGEYLLNVAKAYKVRPAYINSGEGDDGYPWSGDTDSQALAPIASSATRHDYVRFPLLEGFAGMGRGDYVGDYPEIVDWVEVTKEWAKQKLHGVPHGAVRVITGRGQSMRGTYNDGDLIFIDSRVKQFDADAAYCYRWEGKVHIKRLQQIGKGKVRIISANPEWPAIEVKLADLEIGGMALAAWTLVEF
jgi:phage repressor protein C with HTH and peptisase S24 domain